LYNVVGVRFKKAGKIYYFDPASFLLEDSQYVIVETARGVEYGKVVVPQKVVGDNDVVLPLKQVLRPADDRDRIQVEENAAESNDEYEEAKEGMPDLGEVAMTPDGRGKVVGLNVLERLIQVYLQEQERTVEYTLEELLACEKNLI